MKYLKTFGLAAIVAMAMSAFAAGGASATGLEVGGSVKEESIELTKLLKKTSTSTILKRTDGSFANTCTEKHWTWHTVPPFHFTAKIFGVVTTYKFSKCTRPVETHKAGSIDVEHISGTTNGTVSMSGSEVTVGSPFGTLNCKTGTGVDVGTLTGVKEGHATMDVNAVTNCGFLVPSAIWEGTYEIATPTGLGVVE